MQALQLQPLQSTRLECGAAARWLTSLSEGLGRVAAQPPSPLKATREPRSAERDGAGCRAERSGLGGRHLQSLSFNKSAIRLSSGNERAFILRIRLLRWTFTVDSVMPISFAIC